MKLLIDKKGRKYLCEGKELHTNLGVVNLKSEVDGIAKSHLGHEFSVLMPRIVDICEKMPRVGSIILKKDLGAIVTYTGIGTGDVIVEAGVGSGATSIFLANIVRPTGKVYAYEIREEFARIAGKNIAMAGLEKFVEIKLKDVREGIDEICDVVVLDLPDPWNVAQHAYKALKNGGFFWAYTPYAEQAKKTVEALRKQFKDVKTIETFEREIEIKEVGIRPATKMLGHTAYLTFARKR